MRSIFKLMVVMIGCFFCYGGDKYGGDKKYSDVEFGIRLYKALSQENRGNIVFSPYSLWEVMAAASIGAEGTTLEEFKNLLALKTDKESIKKIFYNLDRNLISNESELELKIGNALCIRIEGVRDTYKEDLREFFSAEVFRGGIDEINRWVKEKTSGKIESIVSELPPLTACVLLNAIYFKGLWKSKFNPENTYKGDFYCSDGNTVKVDFMYQKGDFRYLTRKEFSLISLPYKKENISMVILLPNKTAGYSIEQIESFLTEENIRLYLEELFNSPEKEIQCHIPKWAFKMEYKLKTMLESLGLKEAFLPGKADFTSIGWKKGELFISEVIHKAVIEVDEEGTVASAASGVIFVVTGVRLPIIFKADHPFLFIIWDNNTCQILFMGRVTDPSGKGGK